MSRERVPGRIASLALATALAWGCQNTVEHHDVRAIVAAPAERAVATVNGKPISAEELRLEMERTGSSAEVAVEELVNRELLVQQALETGAGDETLVVKSAMVRVLLEDEIEGNVGPDQVSKEAVEALEATIKLELSKPEGFRIAGMSIFVPKQVEGKEPTPEQLAEWTQLAGGEAARVREWLREDPTAERMRSFDGSTLAKPLGFSIRADMTVVDPVELTAAEMPDGWTPNGALASAARAMNDGEVGIVNMGPAFFVVLRLEEIPREVATADAVAKEAGARALVEVRRERLEEWLDELRGASDVDLYPEVIAESAQGTETTAQ